MLRITTTEKDERMVTLKIEGRVGGDEVGELSRAVSAALAGPTDVMLNMAGVTFADRRGVELLRGLRDRGVRLASCSAFIAALLNGEAHEPERRG